MTDSLTERVEYLSECLAVALELAPQLDAAERGQLASLHPFANAYWLDGLIAAGRSQPTQDTQLIAQLTLRLQKAAERERYLLEELDETRQQAAANLAAAAAANAAARPPPTRRMPWPCAATAVSGSRRRVHASSSSRIGPARRARPLQAATIATRRVATRWCARHGSRSVRVASSSSRKAHRRRTSSSKARPRPPQTTSASQSARRARCPRRPPVRKRSMATLPPLRAATPLRRPRTRARATRAPTLPSRGPTLRAMMRAASSRRRMRRRPRRWSGGGGSAASQGSTRFRRSQGVELGPHLGALYGPRGR